MFIRTHLCCEPFCLQFFGTLPDPASFCTQMHSCIRCAMFASGCVWGWHRFRCLSHATSPAAAEPGSSQGCWWCLGGCKGVRKILRKRVLKSWRKAVPKRGQLEALAGCPQVENEMQGCEISAQSYALQPSKQQLFLTAGAGFSGRTAGNGWASFARGKHSRVLFEREGLNSVSGESPQVDENKIKMCERSIETNKGWENQPSIRDAPVHMAGTLKLNAKKLKTLHIIKGKTE